MALKKVLADTPLTLPSNQGPVWKGPSVDGISQTLLSRYLSCAERFRVSAIDGLQVTPTFNNRLEFGNMWHAAEEAFAEHGNAPSQKNPAQPAWQRSLLDYGNELGARYPTQLMQIVHWLTVTEALFPAYITYWSKHPDTLNRTPLLQEERFAVPYKLPSGRTVLLRGKWDSVDLVGRSPKEGDVYYTAQGERKTYSKTKARTEKNLVSVNNGIWLMENKTKSTIDVQKINRQLRFDLQSMLYLVALKSRQETDMTFKSKTSAITHTLVTTPIKGVRYNVIKRSTHKTADSMMKKVGEDIRDGRAGEWFSRWNVEIDSRDLQVFKTKALDPILDNLLDDYEWWKWCYENKGKTLGRDNAKTGERAFSAGNLYDSESRRIRFPHHRRRHFIMPYIGYNPLSEGGESDLDNYLFTGSEIGLQRVDTLFPELA